MGKKIISIVLTVVLVISFIPYSAFAAETLTAKEKTETNKLIRQLKSMNNELVIADGYDTFILYHDTDDASLYLTHSYQNGDAMTVLTTFYDPFNPEKEIFVNFDVFIGSSGVTLEAVTNITRNNYCASAESISFEVKSSSYYLSQSEIDKYKKLAATAFRLLITAVRDELAKKYSIDLKYCGFRSIGSLLQNDDSGSGNKKGSWKQDKKGWWYSYSDGTYAKNAWVSSGGKWYYFGSNGYMVKGWKQIGGKWYYFANGAMVTGWKKVGAKWYFFDRTKGTMRTGWVYDGGKYYYFVPATGAMVTGWKEIGKKWYFFKSGAMQTGWAKIGGKWYFFTKDGNMITGWKQLAGKWYYFNNNGAMVTGTVTIGGKKYQFGTDGALVDSAVREDLKYYRSIIEPALQENYGSNYIMRIDGDTVYIAIWQDGVDQAAQTAKENPSLFYDRWTRTRDDIHTLAVTLYEAFEELGIYGAHCEFELLSDIDQKKVLLSFYDGILLYDYTGLY